MTFNPSIPLNSDSPSIFPAQSQTNYTRLQTIVGADHQFNLTAAANDGYHNLIHMTLQAPTGALASTGRLYVKTVGGLVQLYYMDSAGTEYQVTPSFNVISGTVNVSPAYATITAIPANMFGEVFLWQGRFIQAGTFVSDGTVVNGYSYAEKYVSGSASSPMLALGFDAAGANLLNLTVANTSGIGGFNVMWNYKVFYRSKT